MTLQLVKKSTESSRQLEVFLRSLNVKENLELYSSAGLTYISIDLLLPILSVELKWFVKNASTPIHYIKVANKYYVNKYGITILIAHSKEAVSFKLQDYLYELLYQVETNGQVDKSDVKSREELFAIIEADQKETQLIKEDMDTLRCDYAFQVEEIQNYKENISRLEFELNDMEENYLEMKTLATKLASYVRITKKTPPKEVDSHLIDVEDEEEVDLEEVKKAAVKAKKDLKKNKDKRQIIKPEEKDEPVVYALIRSIYDTEEGLYQWSVDKNVEDKKFKEDSMEFRLHENISKFKWPSVWYLDLPLKKQSKRLIDLLLSIQNTWTETNMERIINEMILN